MRVVRQLRPGNVRDPMGLRASDHRLSGRPHPRHPRLHPGRQARQAAAGPTLRPYQLL